MPRGRLIFPFKVEIFQLDTAATEADPDGAGPLDSGYDEDFRQPVKVSASSTDQVGTSARQESGPLLVKAQIEPEQFERLQMLLSGQSPESRFSVVMHYKDLEAAGLVDTEGRSTIYKNDRLSRILDMNENLVETIPNPPGLFVHEVVSRGWGLGGANPKRNLLLVTFEERATSAAR